MRFLFGFIWVLVLAAMGCSETAGTNLCEGVTCDDDGNECTGDGVCDPADGECDYAPVEDGTACGDDAGACQEGSCEVACTEQGIRDAIAAGGGPYTFDCDGSRTVVTEAEIVIDNDVILDGEENLIIDGSRHCTALSVQLSVTAELRNLTLKPLSDEPDECLQGTIVGNSGTLALTRVKTSPADFVSIDIAGDGVLTLNETTLSGALWAGELTTITESTLGDIELAYAGELTMRNSTVLGEFWTVGSPRPPDSRPRAVLTNCTLANDDSAASLRVDDFAEVVAAGTIIMGGCDISGGTLTSDGYNVESPGNTCSFDQTGDQANVSADDLKLGEPADNGGPTETRALGEGSVAIDVIAADDCEVDTDQRGEPRDPMCDMGAFERQPDDQ